MKEKQNLPASEQLNVVRTTLFTWKQLWQYAKGQRWRLVIVAISLLAITAAGILFPLIIGQGIGEVIANKNYDQLNQLALFLLAIFAVQSAADFFQNYNLNYIGETIVYTLRRKLHAKLLQLPMSFHSQHKSGELASRIASDTTTLQTVFAQVVPGLLGAIISLVGTMAVMISLNPRLTLFIFSIIPVIALVAWGIGKLIQKLGTKNQDLLARSTGVATEALKNIGVVKAFTAEEYEKDRYATGLRQVFQSVVRTGRLSALNSSIIAFLGFGAIAAIIWIAGQQAIEGVLTAGLITTFLIYGIQIAMTIAELSQFYAQTKLAAGSSSRVFEIINAPVAMTEPAEPVLLRDKDLEVTVKDVSFSYGSARILHGVNLELKPGEVVALVGPSGAGKTTLFELLQRFYDPTSGTIKINGINIKRIGSQELRRHIAVVSQSAPLFSGSVRDNIAYGNKDASNEEIIKAAQAAYAHDFINDLPEGYDTILGENGVGLSGGQRQRIAIARAVIKNAPILLLDEATSALDTRSERLVRRALDQLIEGRTALVIAHRLSTIENADKIYSMNNGTVVESGTHQQLIKQRGLYAELYSQQKNDKETHEAPVTTTA